MAAEQSKNQPARVGPLSEDTARQFLANQAQELALRSKELDLRKTELQHNSQFAEAALTAQAKDRVDERQHKRSAARERMIFGAIVLVVLIAFAAYALYLNKDAIVIELVKIIGPFVVGAAGGYYVGKSRQPPSQPTENSN
jgi:hypothetical protein